MKEQFLSEGRPFTLKDAVVRSIRKLSNIVTGAEIPEIINGSNIFMGIGLITTNRRVSNGLGLGFINMACLAAELQQSAEAMHFQSHILVLVADQHALDQTDDYRIQDRVKTIGLAVAQTTQLLFRFLGVNSDRIHLIMASNPGWPKIGGTYLTQEIIDIIHAHCCLDCGIKIGWQTKRKSQSGVTIRDEHWFDQIAIDSHPDKLNDMAFVRAPEWWSLETHLDRTIEDRPTTTVEKTTIVLSYGEEITRIQKATQNTGAQNLPLPPYFADHERFVLGKPIDLTTLRHNGILTKQMRKALSTIESAVATTLCYRPTETEEKGLLQQLIDYCQG